jgi:hypothetical protein
VVEGKVTIRKQPWYKRFARSMVADDVTNIREYVFTEYVLPGIRNLIRDSIVGTVDRGLYGTSRRRERERGERGSSFRTRYDRMSEPGEPRRMLAREARARHDFDDIVLDERDEAVEVVEGLMRRVSKYGAATVADMYDMLGTSGSYADRNYGWTDLRDADVRQTRGGWLLDLPRPELLR